MLKKFEVKNYKNFKEKITIDFTDVGGYQFSTDCITESQIGKMIIYGRNATGKTNLGRAIMDITDNLVYVFKTRGNTSFYLNADSEEDFAQFSYVFQFGKDEVIYQYSKFSNEDLRDEELILNDERIFYCDFENYRYDFRHLSKISAGTVIVERYLESMERNDDDGENEKQTLSFLRWIISNTALKSDSVLLKLLDFVNGMSILTAGSSMNPLIFTRTKPFFELLEKKEELERFEDFLNFMGIECKLELQKLPDGESQLYFKHEKLVPFYGTASSGTLALVDVYRRLVLRKVSSLLYLDEFDAFYHYEMAENVIRYLMKIYPDCQVIMTTHNTNLMTNRLMRPDCLFVLSGGGKLTPLCKATKRELREGHNLEKMYISGEFMDYE